mgnify:CR=1 FL=1
MNKKIHLNHIVYVYNNQGVVYAESAAVDGGKVLSAKPLTLEAMKRIFAVSHESERESFSEGLIDPGVLSFSDRIEDKHLLWYRKATRRTIKTTKNVYTIFLPAMLFFWDSYQLKIFALKASNRPTMNTKLYYAPIKNLIGDGYEFCWGNVNPTITETKINRIISQWEKYIWDSSFNNDGPYLIKSKRIYLLYYKLQKSQGKFPVRELIDTKLTLQQVL